jgi:ankyrin repeat protein
VSAPDQAGRTPLHYAALENDVEQVKALLAQGVDPNVGDQLGFTALHFSAQQGAVEACRALLDAGAEVDPVNSYGNTPLFVAVFNSRGRGDLIKLLRERGADPLRANRSGQTPLGLARLIDNYDVAQFFADFDG